MKRNRTHIRIGQNALSGKPINIPLEELMDTHTFVLGRSGVGKSYLLEMFARAIIQSGYGLIFLDGKGDLFDNLQKFLASRIGESKTILIDPTDDKQSIGINYLEIFGQTSPEALASQVLEGMKKFFKEDKEYKPWLEEWGAASLLPLIKGGFTLLELFQFTSLREPGFRKALLAKLGDGFYQQKWRELEVFREQEQANILNVVKTRASKFWTSEPLKHIFGQTKTSFDWLRLMNEGKVLLANLGPGQNNLTEEITSFIGAAMIHQLLTNAPLRPKGHRRPVFLIVDEFQKFVCNDFADALDRLRGYGIYLILSCQRSSQLSEENPQVYDSVMTNCRNKFIFSISRKDGEEMALELFTGYIHQDRIKDEILQWKLRPVETTREIVSEGDSWGHDDVSGLGSVLGTTISPDGDLLISTSSSVSQVVSNIYGGSRAIARVPWYEYEQYQEVTSRTFYTPDQLIERYIAWVVDQDARHLQMKLGSKKPIPMITVDLKEARVLPSHVKEFRNKVFKKTALPIPELEKEIEGRVKAFLSANEVSQKTKYPESFRVPKKSKRPKD